LELYVCLSNLKGVHKKFCRTLGVNPKDTLGLAIWEQLKNIEHRVKRTRAYASIIENGRGIGIMTRNKVSLEEIQSCIDGNCLTDKEKLDLTHLRGEVLIRNIVGEENYERYIDPWTHEMVTKLYLPTNKN
jgi:hypothetical protein